MSNEPAQVIEAHGVYSGFDLSIRGRGDETEAVLSEGTAYCDGATITAPFTVALREGIEDGWHCLRINGGALEFGETFPAGCVPLYALLIDSGRFVAFRDMRRRIWIEYFDRGTESGEGRRDASFLSERPVYIHRVAAAMQDIRGIWMATDPLDRPPRPLAAGQPYTVRIDYPMAVPPLIIAFEGTHCG